MLCKKMSQLIYLENYFWFASQFTLLQIIRLDWKTNIHYIRLTLKNN